MEASFDRTVVGEGRSNSRYAAPVTTAAIGGPVSGVEVDPEVLRQYSGSVDHLSAQVSECRLPGAFSRITASMPGSSTAFAASSAVPEFRRALAELSTYYSQISGAVMNAAGEFERDDDEIAQGIREIAQPE